jgi:hypothetical protein
LYTAFSLPSIYDYKANCTGNKRKSKSLEWTCPQHRTRRSQA